MSRDPQYQRLLNSKRWKELRMQYLQQHPLCERCLKEGHVRSAIDVHHRVPVETATSLSEMEALCYRWSNLEALCIPHHKDTHRLLRSQTKEGHQRAEADSLERWRERLKTRPKRLGG